MEGMGHSGEKSSGPGSKREATGAGRPGANWSDSVAQSNWKAQCTEKFKLRDLQLWDDVPNDTLEFVHRTAANGRLVCNKMSQAKGVKERIGSMVVWKVAWALAKIDYWNCDTCLRGSRTGGHLVARLLNSACLKSDAPEMVGVPYRPENNRITIRRDNRRSRPTRPCL